MYNLKTKVEDLDVDKLKTVSVNLKKLSDAVSKNVVKKTKCKKINLKVNNLVNEIPDTSTSIHINQYNVDEQN